MIQRLWRFLCLALVLGLLAASMGFASAAPSAAPGPLTLSSIIVNFGDNTGGFVTYAGWTGAYHLYLYDADGNVLLNNADGTVSLPLNVGSQTFTFFGDYYPYNPVTRPPYANQLQLTLNGSTSYPPYYPMADLVINDSTGNPHPVNSPWWQPATGPSTTVNGYIVTVTNFTLSEHTSINRVSPNSPFPGGFTDGTGSLTIDVQRVMPTSKDQCKNGGWQNFGLFKNQGDCVSFVATNGKNQPN